MHFLTELSPVRTSGTAGPYDHIAVPEQSGVSEHTTGHLQLCKVKEGIPLDTGSRERASPIGRPFNGDASRL